ncbi:DMT family transporter [Stakelama tenebrarum]|uniref:EamA family transporter n=1 Tax=Stakelama tenebrarum TaxID=2711215 RepID=A0A6G6YAQ2_9SPHN|nr:EamA family transporter [Sphingosinithalassobacter tenebrarum]QIG81653.1 EamA family transporter [Sphingosinithalassobacter tenebrarum]
MSNAPPPQSARLAILLPFFAVTLIWGSTWLVIVDQIAVVPPSWSVAYRFLLAAVAMFVVAAVRGNSLLLDARGIAFAAAFGIPQFALNFNFVYRAEQHVTSGLVAVVFALLLVPNALFARVFLGQKLGRQLLVGSCVAMIGVAMLFLHEARRDPAASGEVLIGVGLTLAGILSASVANVLQATTTAKSYPLPTLIAWAMLLGALVDAVFAYAVAGPPTVEWRFGYFLGIAYLGIFASAVAFSLYFRMIQVIGPAKAAYSSVLIPVIAMLLSTLFEGYRWSPLTGAGAVLVIAGLVLALRARRPNR